MEFFEDTNGSLCVHWEQANGHKKRAWVQHRPVDDLEKNWAGTSDGRYINVVREDKESGNPSGSPTDFPIFCPMPDRQILEAFVLSICAITGLELKGISN